MSDKALSKYIFLILKIKVQMKPTPETHSKFSLILTEIYDKENELNVTLF